MTSPRLTTLICTHNRVALLKRVLASPNTARQPVLWDVGILIGANNCRESTHDLLGRYQVERETEGWLPLSWFIEATPGKSYALNSAQPRIDPDLAAFVDDDHRVHDGYRAGICAAAEAFPRQTCVLAACCPTADGSEQASVHDRRLYRIYPLRMPRFDQGEAAQPLTPKMPCPAVATCSCAPRGSRASALFPPRSGKKDTTWAAPRMRTG